MVHVKLFILAWITVMATGHAVTRQNVVLITDITSQSKLQPSLEYIINRISLQDNRIALYTTFGFHQSFYNFASRKCLINAVMKYLRLHKHSLLHENLQHVMNLAHRKTLQEYPYSTKTLFIILTDSSKYRYLEDRKSVFIVMSKELKSKNIGKTVNIINGNTGTCNSNNGRYQFDECKRLCQCYDGRLVKCYRIRREFSSLSLHQRKTYIEAYLQLSTLPQYKEIFSKLSGYHRKAFYKGLHYKIEQFLPWHRKYMLLYENLLQTIDCRITLPYWNWAQYYAEAWSVTPKYHMWSQNGGFGGNGNPNNGFCVNDGPFSYKKFNVIFPLKTHNDVKHFTHRNCEQYIKMGTRCPQNATFTPDDNWEDKRQYCRKQYKNKRYFKCLRRSFTWYPPSLKSVRNTIEMTNIDHFNEFALLIMFDFHDRVHLNIGGQMRTQFSSAAPEIWLHHAFIDAIWNKYQEKGEEYKLLNLTKLGNSYKLLVFEPKTKANEYIDNDDLAGCSIKVLYTDIYDKGNSSIVKRTFHQEDEMKPLDQRCLPCYPYKITTTPIKRLDKLHKNKPYLFDDDFTLDCW